MPTVKGLEWTFDTVASQYEKFRPGYVEELYQKLFDYAPIGSESSALEIGIGAGQATLPILKTGCRLTAVECGARFCELCREKFREFSGFSVIEGKFEDVELEPERFDLIYSASAFHWIPEEVGYLKVFSLLKTGGVFARFANHPVPCKDDPKLREDLDKLYEQYYYKTKRTAHKSYGEEDAGARAAIAGRYGFTELRCELFHRTRTFSAKEYVQLMGTYSDHIAIEEKTRLEFFSRVEEAVNDHGGIIRVFDLIDLQLARKP